MAGIDIRSEAFSDHTLMPERLAQTGDNVSPALEWSHAPDGTTELVLMCEDPDAPGGTFLHWLVTRIDPRASGCEEGMLPVGGVAWPNTAGVVGWSGPKPPAGDPPHRYFFRVFALSDYIDLPETPGAEDVHAAVADRELASGTLVGLFGR
ncbi:YbhB/YbcL family Raf kinase inhibitor-like protein [Bailinhaonella thermotolerans]|uniref:YbhB/YbcL family Raf kinase inhibitor-like protein n=1 Tax=Bailinhaonella thermotolerans TaxID=1070861 RepID=A0A3A4AU65_9ACTN|nr:YbhB/YbcL family Raf kinase inhibitor-like protein [Bailinhaonella thermotolerans]RJL33530.1 YbhB/YbcL family Raf kinase inhibitor-like protein [Bailinhaonella thermotolerans]